SGASADTNGAGKPQVHGAVPNSTREEGGLKDSKPPQQGNVNKQKRRLKPNAAPVPEGYKNFVTSRHDMGGHWNDPPKMVLNSAIEKRHNSVSRRSYLGQNGGTPGSVGSSSGGSVSRRHVYREYADMQTTRAKERGKVDNMDSGSGETNTQTGTFPPPPSMPPSGLSGLSLSTSTSTSGLNSIRGEVSSIEDKSPRLEKKDVSGLDGEYAILVKQEYPMGAKWLVGIKRLLTARK
ncbi:hypothetical protein BB560_005157, partial [Smittium megazygosporum]